MAALIWVAAPVGFQHQARCGQAAVCVREAGDQRDRRPSVLPLPVCRGRARRGPARVSAGLLTFLWNCRLSAFLPFFFSVPRGHSEVKANELLKSLWCGAFQASGFPRRQTISTKWADCRWAKSIAAKKLGNLVSEHSTTLSGILYANVIRSPT